MRAVPNTQFARTAQISEQGLETRLLHLCSARMHIVNTTYDSYRP